MSVQRTWVWRRFALAAALTLVVGGSASAQTLIVRGVPAGSSVELVVNSTAAGKATADARGDARIPVNLSAQAGKAEMDAHIYVETCGDVRRVYVVERGLQPPVRADECVRRDITGVFVVRQPNTLVVNMGGLNPTMLLVRGSYDLTPRDPSKIVSAKRTGLVLFGGGGFSKLRDIEFVACGDQVSDCSGNGWGATATAGAELWFKPFLAAHFNYLKPSQVTIRGSGDAFRFTSEQNADILTVAGKVGIPAGRARIFGQYGLNYHRATLTTDQTTDEVTTTTAAGVTLTAKGDRQTLELKTDGWGWSLSGGVEVWLTRRFGIYGEASRVRLKGTAEDEGEGGLDDYLTLLVVGARFRIGGR
jgi:hypothetical protein